MCATFNVCIGILGYMPMDRELVDVKQQTSVVFTPGTSSGNAHPCTK